METDKLIIRMQPRLKARLRLAARADRRNLSDWVRITLEDASKLHAQEEAHERASARSRKKAASIAAAAAPERETPRESP